MEEMDDFGDLYADVEGHVNSGFLATPIFYLGEQAKKDEVGSSPLCSHGEDLVIYDKVHESNGSDDQMKAISSILDIGKETHISKSCSGEKREGDDDCNGRNGVGEAHKFDGFVEEGEKIDTQGMEEEGEWCVSQGSDSEDDLHIVLNDDHRSFRPLRNMSSGHGGVDRADEDEDEDDDLVIVTDKDRKWVERLQLPMDGMEQIAGGGERGNALKSTGNSGVSNQYHSQYSQFKYIRPNGYGKTPCCGKGDVDLNGGSQQMMACSGFISSSSNLGGPALGQNGFDFFLPRNRTILDIDIGTLEQKPWTHPGVDITDFFNFGLNEESWKLYCRQMEQLRQQASMQTNIAFYESPKPCQPKGRAIQVEGGIVERLPSIDVRRPRVRDSDVVIQVALQDAMEDSSVSGKEGADPVDDSISKEFGKGGTEMEGDHCGLENLGIAGGDAEPLSLVPLPHLEQLQFGSSSRRTGSCRLKRCSQPKAAHAASSADHRGNNHVKVRDSVSTDTKELLENVEDARERYKENPSEAETVLFENRSEIADKILSDSCSANLESHSEGSKAGFSIEMEEVPNYVKNSTRSLSRLRESFLSKDHLSGNSGSVVSHSEPENICQDQTSIQEKKYCGRTRLRSVAEIKVPIDDIDAPLQANGKNWYNGLHRTSTHGRRKENMDPYDSYRREDVSYHREREISNRFCRRSLSGKQVRENTHSTHFQSKDLYFRDEVDLYVRSNWSEREYFVKQSVKYRDNERDQGEYYFDQGGITENESAQSSPEYISIYSEKDRYLKRREWDDYFSLDHRHGEESIRQRNGKCVSYCSRKIENPDRRERSSCSPARFDYDNSWKPFERDGGHWVDPDYRSPNSKCYRNIHSLGGRDLHDESPSRNLNYDSWRLRERDLGFWREPDCEGWFVSSSKEPHSLRHRERDSLYAVEGPYLYERSSRQEHKFVNHDSVRGRKKIEDLHIDREMGKFDLIGWEGKFPRRRCAAEDPKSVGQWDRDHVIDTDSEALWGSKNLYRREVSPHTQKVENDCPIICSKIERVDRYNSGRSYDNNNEKWLDKYPIMPECEASAAKEEPEDGEVSTTGTKWVSEKTVPISDKITEKKLHSENAMDKNKVGGYDDGHILETLAKMERRRERFKEPVIIKKELDETPKPPPPSDLVVEMEKVKQQRPARKRRWCSS